MRSRILLCGILLPILSACTATTQFQSEAPDVVIKINGNAPVVANQDEPQTYRTTSFGQYHFEVTQEGKSPMYGLIPLKFNGGYLAADILFFAPAAFFNLREVFPYYQFDIDTGVVRYKKHETDAWSIYTPTPAEAARAKAYFQRHGTLSKAGESPKL